MKCQFCHKDVPGLIRKFVYGDGIWVCPDCYKLIQTHRYQPYSQVMEKVAVLEAGYHVNRKLARATKH
jgi:ribosomal protein L37AE/L43A